MPKRNQENNNKPEKQKRDVEFSEEMGARKDFEEQERNAEAKAQNKKK